ncbi:multiple C2 and transmembrane domain-containing protein 2 [Aplochiton taeniatus]
MEPKKKKNFFGNLRIMNKPLFANKNKPDKETPLKKGKKLKYRRSISVPNLSIVQNEMSTDSGLLSKDSDAIYFVSSGQIDRDDTSAESLHTSGDSVPTSVVSAVAAEPRAYSSGDPVSQCLDRVSSLGEQKKPPPEQRWLSQGNIGADRWSLPSNRASAPAQSAEDRSNPVWSADLDDLSGEPISPFTAEEFFSMDPSLEEDLPEEENQEEMEGGMPRLGTERSASTKRRGALMPLNLHQWEELSEQGDSFGPLPNDTAGNRVSGGDPPQILAPFQRYLLIINLKEGRGLAFRERSGKIDPYVKFKLEGKQIYKSKVVYKNTNPQWNESFSFPLREKEHNVEVRLYDRNRTTDQFMGSSTIALKNLELDRTCEMELSLDDPSSKKDSMGKVLIDISLTFRDATIKRSPNQNQIQILSPNPAHRGSVDVLKKSQLWGGVYSITLVEGQDLPQSGCGDVYVRFRLGEQKYKSKNLCIQPNPQWKERFEFNQYEDNLEPLQVEVFSKRGRKSEESLGMSEIDLSRLSTGQRQLYTHVLDPGKGMLVFLITLSPCEGVSISDIQNPPLEQQDERDNILEKFSLKNCYKSMREVGFLQVKVIRATDISAADLNGKSDPFCVVELGNGRLQTQTVYKTLNPEWNKVFTIPIKDIHDVLELCVLDENGDKATSFLGKVAIPLLSVQNGQQLTFILKKENLVRQAKGTITIEMEVIYNKVRAGARTFQPKEKKCVDENPKFNKKVLAQNIYRVRKITTAALYTLQYINSCFQWESTQRSIIAFLIFVVSVWNLELFMLPLFFLLLIGYNYFQAAAGWRSSSNQDLVNMSMADDEEEDEKESGKKGLMEKIHMVQEIVLFVQNVLDEIASAGERIKNTVNWTVPFMSCLACVILFVGTVALYYIPVRYVVLIWGVNKFTMKLRNPHAIDNNEILNFLKRVPSDVQKVRYNELRAASVQGPPKKRR